MNIRSLTRGDGVVIVAAVLLFIASFLDLYDTSISGNAWDGLGLGLGVYMGGVIGAALVVVNRLLPRPRKVLGLDPGAVGTSFTILSAWVLFWELVDVPSSVGAGSGLMLGFIAALVVAAGCVAGPLVPALRASLIPAPRPAAPQPYAVQGAQGGYGYPGGPQSSYGGQVQPNPYGAAQPQQATTPFSPFWFAVPAPRPLYAEDGSPTPIAELSPGVWYLAVDQRGQGLLTEMQDGRRGVLQDTSNIQRG
ncbi:MULTISPECIES: hypothetical protein [Streptomyces]|uniref:hypothetical protein n=1 Tax=Streptomyces TaxID=1883 RepID=UPI00163C921D|nr:MULTISPECIES: hypothetical protein [Streptomyces]MCM3264285.1 hypothetical protein [Streptomyces thermoviolaceus]WTD49436.1 hypothetical protein OG899_19140 [Streptomyces thermoviolaceus]GGV61148.1 hypothetical protein GCM10010499_02270 [Streptomyces thermoviolaceus subsp. apingens]GHA80259.1 hypothetical protein GCM10010512_09350 [Streptomyces thermoviolaceus subsp. thermoviolaceus]